MCLDTERKISVFFLLFSTTKRRNLPFGVWIKIVTSTKLNKNFKETSWVDAMADVDGEFEENSESDSRRLENCNKFKATNR